MNTIFHLRPFHRRKPAQFTNPFMYRPNEICIDLMVEVMKYIENHEEIKAAAAEGKMFGVLAVETEEGSTGFIAAYSGLLGERNDHGFFVPPVFDAQQPDGYFKRKEAEITALNTRIDTIEHGSAYRTALRERKEAEEECAKREEEYRLKMKEAKAARDEKRRQPGGTTPGEEAAMIRESQFMKAELHRMKQCHRERTEEAGRAVEEIEAEIMSLKKKRKAMSEALQRWLFSQYNMLNAKGERRNLCDIFATTPQQVPPAGAGDCCAPKLLQYAYLNKLKPVCMAEFWYGMSPKHEVRHHGNFYTACRGKCKPILEFMLQGLDVEEGDYTYAEENRFEIVYEDEDLAVVHKPVGMHSVSSPTSRHSIGSEMRKLKNNNVETFACHRLDMDTSGLVVVAYTPKVMRYMQKQFAARTVKKRYVAVLDGLTDKPDEGVISIPLSPDLTNRPYQTADYVNGKEAVTRYRITGTQGGKTLIELYPLTGRTHQLRMHCALADGLGVPILGDRLYGRRAERMYLHAEAITFTHPMTGKTITVEKKADFRMPLDMPQDGGNEAERQP